MGAGSFSPVSLWEVLPGPEAAALETRVGGPGRDRVSQGPVLPSMAFRCAQLQGAAAGSKLSPVVARCSEPWPGFSSWRQEPLSFLP